MGMYVPQMQQVQRGPEWGKNVAGSLLEGVRMNREYEHKERQHQLAIQAGERAERAMVMAEDEYGTRKQDRADLKKLTQGIAKYKIADSKRMGAVHENMDDLTETSIFGSEIDPDDKRFYFGYKDEEGKRRFLQRASPREMSKRKATASGVTKPEYDPSLIDTFKDPSFLKYLPTVGGSQDGGGNLLYNSVMNQLLTEY